MSPASRSLTSRSRLSRPRTRTGWGRYWEDTQQPLYCLLFLFPLVATYEFGGIMLRSSGVDQRLVAVSMVRSLLSGLGFSAVWLPGIALLATLLLWHVFIRERWQIDGWVLPLMLIESLVLTLPIFVMASFMTGLPLRMGDATFWQQELVARLGAGIFEELVFRLYLITGLLLVLDNMLRLPKWVATVVAIGTSAVVFSLCHCRPIGSELFVWHTFALRAVLGGYLALVFVGRGLGVATAAHSAYNLILLLKY
jgi:membrane protease YdiL (CAAX protease family)